MADNIQATPRNYLGGLLTDAYNWMQSPERTQQMQGFAGLLGTTGLPQTIERMAYGEPLTNIGRANVPLLKPETADALMTVAPMVGPAARGAKMLPKNLPVGMSIKPVDDVVSLLTPKNSFTYPQEEAMRLAQQRAALPISEGGLGLKPNNTAAERAAAMGFEDALHGTTQGRNLENFSTTRSVWGSDNPKVANTYAKGRLEFGRPNGQAIMPLSIRSEKPLVYDARGNSWRSVPAVMPNEGGDELFYTTDKLAKYARDNGFDLLKVENVFDVGSGRIPTSIKGEKELTGTTYAVFNPENIRSRFAAFDPWRKTAATAAAMGVAAPDLLAQEQQPYQGLLGR